jgi:hypothetical protein
MKNKTKSFVAGTIFLMSFIAMHFLLKYHSSAIVKQVKNSRLSPGMDEDFRAMEQIAFEALVKKLAVYSVYDANGALRFVRLGRDNDGGYVVPEKSLIEADALLGYGIADDISFEESFSDTYNKPSFGFDCGTRDLVIKNKQCHFIRECIASESFLYAGQKSSGKLSTFPMQLAQLGLKGKKVFIKMDIEGAEYEAFEDIYPYSDKITGIALEVHFQRGQEIMLLKKMIKRLNKDFYLVHLHGNNCCGASLTAHNVVGDVPRVLELTFVNKNIVSRAHVSESQNFPNAMDMPCCSKRKQEKFGWKRG